MDLLWDWFGFLWNVMEFMRLDLGCLECLGCLLEFRFLLKLELDMDLMAHVVLL